MNSKLATGLLLISLAVALPIAAQVTADAYDSPALPHRCSTVAIVADTPLLPSRLIAPYLQRRSDFHALKLALSGDPAAADVLVELNQGESGHTIVLVTNRFTGINKSIASAWTDYPGMVAVDVMDQLKMVCPEPVVAQPEESAEPDCSASVVAPSKSSFAACSHTSWMDNREIYEALKFRNELTQWAVQLLSGCHAADTVLDITHNVDRTAEWNWKLRSAQGTTITDGFVIADSSREAATKIAEDAVRGFAFEPAIQDEASTGGCEGQVNSNASPTIGQYGVKAEVVHSGHGQRFKHVMGKAAFYAGEGIAATAIVSGYAAWYAAMGIAMSADY
jgi:hypothetical protein